ncbi:MAG TPA: hypothetical protein PLG77_00085 [Burkholderiaceae bacterium]|nr:hypothetical protein [Burkholderiaceae bacterium]
MQTVDCGCTMRRRHATGCRSGARRDHSPMGRSFSLFTLCQGRFLTRNVVFIAIDGMVGLSVAPRAWMATLPIAGRMS